MGFKSFMTEPRTMSVGTGVGTTKTADRKHILDAPENIAHNTVSATIGTLASYVKDIVNPAVDGMKSGMNIFNPRAYVDNGGFFKNVGKSLGGLVTREATAVKNAVGGIIGGIGHTYQRGIADNVHDALSSTTDHIPLIGPGFGNVIRALCTIPALAGKVPSFLVNQVDQLCDAANMKTARTGKDIPKTTLRV